MHVESFDRASLKERTFEASHVQRTPAANASTGGVGGALTVVGGCFGSLCAAHATALAIHAAAARAAERLRDGSTSCL
jgi:hypothetical protein